VASAFVSADQNYYGAEIGDLAEGQGNLSGIYPGAFISDVEHKTVVEVNETGTVAVGVTGVGIGTTAMPETVNLAINHPFFYAIRDNTSGDLLFVGVLMNPGAG
jgi:serpin B